MLWLGDLGPGRYAVVVYRQATGWSRVVLIDPAGAPVEHLPEGDREDDVAGPPG